jgi:uncharacterized membrane protein HdeD (DUF308 family)
MLSYRADPDATWPFFLARALAALLLCVALLANLTVALAELTGALGFLAIMEGVLCLLIWQARRDARLFGYEGAASIALGFGVLQLEPSARALLVFVATKSLVVGAVELYYAWQSRRTALHPWLLSAAAVSGLEGLGFAGVVLFGYDALDLRPCIAGCSGIVGALLLVLALKLRTRAPAPSFYAPSVHLS